MTYVLHIETSGEICSVALAKNGVLINYLESEEKQVHSALLTKQIEEIIRLSQIHIEDLSGVAVSKGPGDILG